MLFQVRQGRAFDNIRMKNRTRTRTLKFSRRAELLNQCANELTDCFPILAGGGGSCIRASMLYAMASPLLIEETLRFSPVFKQQFPEFRSVCLNVASATSKKHLRFFIP